RDEDRPRCAEGFQPVHRTLAPHRRSRGCRTGRGGGDGRRRQGRQEESPTKVSQVALSPIASFSLGCFETVALAAPRAKASPGGEQPTDILRRRRAPC